MIPLRDLVVKETRTTAGKKVWGLYNPVRGSWPYELPGIGRIRQDHPKQEDADAECLRVAKWIRKKAATK